MPIEQLQANAVIHNGYRRTIANVYFSQIRGSKGY
jgi:hypothetical protein